MMEAQSPSPSPASSRRWPVLRFLRRRLRSWLERHQHPFNLGIHLIGIPLAMAGVVMLFFLPWYWGVGAVVVGYVLQYIGHAVEGNDVGEWALIKRMLGLPYVAVSPRWQQVARGSADSPARGSADSPARGSADSTPGFIQTALRDSNPRDEPPRG